ncbi:hypothetical protein NKH73_28405 [Mesorhizobium sp. M0938]|uniref:Acg family FMN-binding oxidoreductase n=1 Tax=unclassified Mesorhizobium TaxID=325217 RepID=UPI00333A24B8
MLQYTPILQAIAYGVHAPNPHNTQAWKFEVTSDTEALFYLDERRLLPATDPPARQIHIGAGCAIETLAIGMSRHGYTTEVELLPQGAHGFEEIGRKPVARIVLRSNATTRPDNLADGISRRQTNRRPYAGPLVTDHEAEHIRVLAPADNMEVLVLSQPERMRPLLDVFYRAFEIEVKTPHVYDETRDWFRFSEHQRRDRRDGLSIPQLGFDGLKARLMEWSLFNGSPTLWFSTLATNSTLKDTRHGIESARGLVLLKTGANDQSTWLEAGRAFARVHLGLTQLGLTCHPYSQVLQEYPEMAALQTEFNRLLGVRAPEKIQMAVRIGRAERAYVAPRRDPRNFLVGG